MKQFFRNLGLGLIGLLLMTSCAQQELVDTELTEQPKIGIFELYELNRQQNIASYITEDFWLLSYSLIRQTTLQRFEQQQILPLLQRVIRQLSLAVEQQANDEAGLANQDYLQILNSLLGHAPTRISSRAEKELQLIDQAQGIRMSPLWGYTFDYSLFKVRGRYTRTQQSAQYFKTIAYAGAVLFALNASPATGITTQMAERMTVQALRLSAALAENEDKKKLDKLLNWQMGATEDLGVDDYNQVTFSHDQSIQQTQVALFEYAKQQHKQPKILAGLVQVDLLQENQTAADVLTGWRLVPGHYNVENAIIQRLVYNLTGAYIESAEQIKLPFGYSLINGQGVKGFASGKELMALLGSDQSNSWIKQQHEDQFEGYPAAFNDAKALLAKAHGLNKYQLMLLQNWFKEDRREIQQSKLSSALSFWTWQRYINLLYTKQSYTMSSKSVLSNQPRPGATIAPATGLYQDLIALVKLHQAHSTASEWQIFEQLLIQAVQISQTVQSGQELNQQQQFFINNLDREIKNLTGEDQPIVVDVHNNPATGQVLQEAVGYAQIIQTGTARGARFSHYEFKYPIEKRLTDQDWQKLLMDR